MTTLEQPVALTDPAVRESMNQTLRRGLFLLIIGLGLLVGLITAITLLSNASQRLVDDGGQTSGTVVSLIPGDRYTEGSARIQYAVDGRLFTETQDLGSHTSKYRLAQPVTVYYDLQHPSRFTIDGETNEPAWAAWVIAALFVSPLVASWFGAKLLLRRRRLVRVLRRGPWAPVWVERVALGEAKQVGVRIWYADDDGNRIDGSYSYLCPRSRSRFMFGPIRNQPVVDIESDPWHGRWHSTGRVAGPWRGRAVFTVPVEQTGGRLRLGELRQTGSFAL